MYSVSRSVLISMFDRIIGIGCSLTFGYEIDVPGNREVLQYQDYTYTGLLAQHFGVPYSIYARPGASNRDISTVAQQAMHVHSDERCLYICFWSGSDRASYIVNNDKPNSDCYTITQGLIKNIHNYPDHPANHNPYMLELYKTHHGVKQMVYDGLTWFSSLCDHAQLQQQQLLHIHMLPSMDKLFHVCDQQTLPGKHWSHKYTEWGTMPPITQSAIYHRYMQETRYFPAGLLGIIEKKGDAHLSGHHLSIPGHAAACEHILNHTHIAELFDD